MAFVPSKAPAAAAAAAAGPPDPAGSWWWPRSRVNTPDTQSEGGPRGGLHTRHAIRGRAQGGLAHPTRNQGAGPGGACTPNTQSGGGPPRGGWSAVGGGGVMTNAPVSDITKDPITRITRN